MGGFKVQGRGEAAAKKIVDDAIALDQAGCYAMVIEGIPRELAGEITKKVSCPTIGIGAGPDCDGQVLVIYDLLGMNEEFRPKFVKRYDNLAVRIRTAVEEYVTEVRTGVFPDEDHSFSREAPPQNATPYGSARAASGGGVDHRTGNLGGTAASERLAPLADEAAGAACIPLPFRPREK
jgi:3-methyl-2-oxobutanoate hydroxymethyltransferase